MTNCKTTSLQARSAKTVNLFVDLDSLIEPEKWHHETKSWTMKQESCCFYILNNSWNLLLNYYTSIK